MWPILGHQKRHRYGLWNNLLRYIGLLHNFPNKIGTAWSSSPSIYGGPKRRTCFLCMLPSEMIMTRLHPTRQNKHYTRCFQRHKSGISFALITILGRSVSGIRGSSLLLVRSAYPWMAIQRLNTFFLTRSTM